MSIYHWKLGDIALARVCKKVYAKVRVVKNEEGLFHDEKVLGISAKEDDTIEVTWQLCYYVEICRTKQRLWLPYTSLHLAERSRPFYGTDKGVSPMKTSSEPRKHAWRQVNDVLEHSQECVSTMFDLPSDWNKRFVASV